MPRQNIRKLQTRVPARMMATISRRFYPLSIEEVFSWSDELWLHHGVYSQALARAVAYFMTEIEVDIPVAEQEEKQGNSKANARDTYQNMLQTRFNMLQEATMSGIDLVQWGNLFSYMYLPFTRILGCPKCHSSFSYLDQGTHLKLSNEAKFTGACPICRKQATFTFEDKREDLKTSKPNLVKFDPVLCQLDKFPLSGKYEVTVDLCRWPALMDGIQGMNPFFLAQMPEKMLEAAVTRSGYKFAPGVCFHVGLPQPAAMTANWRGYGVPLFMHEFEDVMRVVMIDRVNEAILSNHSTALRCISPAPQAATGLDSGAMSADRSGSPGINLGAFSSSVMQMLIRHSRNPTGYQNLPFPVQYQQFGGDAKQMVMPDMLEYYEKRLLRSMCIPTEFYDQSVSTAGQVIGFQLFERRWRFFTYAMNEFLTWAAGRLGQLLDWEKVEVTLAPPSVITNPQTTGMVMNLAASGKIDDDSQYKMAGLNGRYVRQKLQQQREREQEQAEKDQIEATKQQQNRQFVTPQSEAATQAQIEQAAQPQPGQPPAAAPGPGQSTPAQMNMGPAATMEQLMANANAQAQRLVGLPEAQLRSELSKIKAVDPTMYNQVQGELDRMKQTASTQGVQALRSGQMPPP